MCNSMIHHLYIEICRVFQRLKICSVKNSSNQICTEQLVYTGQYGKGGNRALSYVPVLNAA